MEWEGKELDSVGERLIGKVVRKKKGQNIGNVVKKEGKDKKGGRGEERWKRKETMSSYCNVLYILVFLPGLRSLLLVGTECSKIQQLISCTTLYYSCPKLLQPPSPLCDGCSKHVLLQLRSQCHLVLLLV